MTLQQTLRKLNAAQFHLAGMFHGSALFAGNSTRTRKRRKLFIHRRHSDRNQALETGFNINIQLTLLYVGLAPLFTGHARAGRCRTIKHDHVAERRDGFFVIAFGYFIIEQSLGTPDDVGFEVIIRHRRTKR